MSVETSKDTSQLARLKQFTTVVADTGDFESIKEYEPRDATTNPTLIFQAVQEEKYRHLLEKAVKDSEADKKSGHERVEAIVNRLLVLFGCEILQVIPGRVSTEVSARLSFDVAGSLARARELIAMYEKAGIDRERILIKLASTWEGLRAAETLEKEGIHCNMTLMFSLVQAVGAAEAKATLISPFVGRILDWYKAETGKDYEGADDPGVKSVNEIYTYLKKFDHPVEVMGASFRNKGEIVELAGCDLLTISPKLLGELAESEEPIERKLDPEKAKQAEVEAICADEKTFRWLMNEDAMATEKLAEGIRKFHADQLKLEEVIEKEL